MKKVKSTSMHDMKRIIVIMLMDTLTILFSVWLSEALRSENIFGCSFWEYYGKLRETIILIICILTAVALSNGYVFSWRYAGIKEYSLIYTSSAIGVLCAYILSKILLITVDIDTADYIIIYLIVVFGFTLERFAGGYIRSALEHFSNKHNIKTKKRVMIVGAGDTGSFLIKKMKKESREYYPVVAIDDDITLRGTRVGDVPVAGGREKIAKAVKKYNVQEIILAIPRESDDNLRAIFKLCSATGLKTSAVPSIYEMIKSKANLNFVKEISPKDLLGRSENLVDNKDIFGYIERKVVLVTGGGGSIGSELCRQIAKFHPDLLIIFDIYENNAYELQIELRHKRPNLKLEVLIGSVRDKDRLDEIFTKYKPNVVFHAAAHKHVPLMEDSPNEAIKNNVFGTYNVAYACEKYGVERFVLISTDKAVNPTNIMGASKRIAEMIMQRMSLHPLGGKTIFTAVRFGNVLGSNGSVIPLFNKQIKAGGPVTVTHPEITRFFMTIPEAVQLVMQAGAYANGGEIFILDMGEPVKIVDMAKNLIELSGYIPDIDIKIEFSGLRPGEKMYEELLLDRRKHKATDHDKIFIEKPTNEDAALISEMYALRERLSCNVPIYDKMINWMIESFKMQSQKKADDNK